MAKTTLKSTNGYYVCAEGGGSMYAVADRPAIGPWEEWEVHHYDDGRVSLQAHDGTYMTAEVDGVTVNIRATQSGEWERFTIEVRDDAIVCFKTFHGTYLQAPLGGGANSRICQVPDVETTPGEWEFFAANPKFWVPATPVCRRPLVGPLRIENKLFRDDTGLRRVHFASWFPALRILRDDPTEFYRQLDSITTAGYQGIRVFMAVGGWDDFWNGREVAPIGFQKWGWTGNHLRSDNHTFFVYEWPDYDELLRTLFRECIKRKLRLHLTTGDMQIITPTSDLNIELDLHRWLSRICAEEGGTDVVALFEVTNEYPLNRYGGQSSSPQMGKIIDIWTATVPGLTVTGQGAIPQNEEPASLYEASANGTVCIVHVTREPFGLCLKRTLGLVYWEGDYRAFPKPYWESEPAGPGEDSYQRQDDPANLVALYSMMALTGQASNWFQGAAVRSFKPLESEWGFLELPPILDLIPEDIATWDHGSNRHGGVEYWWRGNDFITVVFSEWDPSPPKPIASWTLYTGTSVHTGTGNPTRGTRELRGAARATGLAIGKFA
jgi:hypothetical protein